MFFFGNLITLNKKYQCVLKTVVLGTHIGSLFPKESATY